MLYFMFFLDCRTRWECYYHSGKIFLNLCSIWILITLRIDLFASCFFMLSRWEEYVINKKDIHHTFSGLSSLAYRKGFLEKPIVNQFWVLTMKGKKEVLFLILHPT